MQNRETFPTGTGETNPVNWSKNPWSKIAKIAEKAPAFDNREKSSIDTPEIVKKVKQSQTTTILLRGWSIGM